jgi:hypothetical protein
MIRKRNAIVPLLLALAVAQARAQAPAPAPETETDPKEALQQLLSKALSVTISARILPPDAQEETPIWNAESTKLTIPGRPIQVRLDGDNVRIYLVCTPYVQENGEVLLLAQGQIWLTQPTDKEARYYSTFYSIPVSFGEKVLYFPLGIAPSSEDQQKDFFNIELEIKIVPYQPKQ